jgi:hypothetical protein
MIEADLQPGDCLVYTGRSLFDWIIRVKTWSKACHVEVYIGNGKTVASRNGKGVAIYSIDLARIYRVLRPVLPFSYTQALAHFPTRHAGRPYGWISLLSFCLIDLHDNGEFCSEFATNFYRDGGFEPFNSDVKPETVAPADFLYINASVMTSVSAPTTPPPASPKA